MFQRILHEEWVTTLPIATFCVFAAVFAITTFQALRLKPNERRRMAALPLDDDAPITTTTTSSTQRPRL